MMKACANDDLDVSMPVFCHSLPSPQIPPITPPSLGPPEILACRLLGVLAPMVAFDVVEVDIAHLLVVRKQPPMLVKFVVFVHFTTGLHVSFQFQGEQPDKLILVQAFDAIHQRFLAVPLYAVAHHEFQDVI